MDNFDVAIGFKIGVAEYKWFFGIDMCSSGHNNLLQTDYICTCTHIIIIMHVFVEC